ncbi:hypothetical protein OSTOST_14707 [Ostertagia ostertagi]
MFRLCLVELMLAGENKSVFPVVILIGGIWCYRDTADYCPYYSAIWTSAVYILNSLVGSAAAKIGTVNLYMAHLVLSLVAVMMCLVSGGLSARNWALVGTYHHPRIDRDEAFCLLGTHDASSVPQHSFRYPLYEKDVYLVYLNAEPRPRQQLVPYGVSRCSSILSLCLAFCHFLRQISGSVCRCVSLSFLLVAI